MARKKKAETDESPQTKKASKVADPVVDEAALEVAAPRPEATHSFVELPTLRFGDSGPAVRKLQILLSDEGHPLYSGDGIFGRKTSQALVGFQRQHGLTPTGSAGPETWSLLLGTPVK